MKIYHGSEKIIEKPIFGAGKPYNDYGLGFYCTDDVALASEWAVDSSRDGFVNCYNINFDGLHIIDLNSGDYTILHWLCILINNRRFDLDTPLLKEAFRFLNENYYVDMKAADVIKGYRADDSYFAFAQDFLGGQISLSQLSVALKLGKLGEQIMIKSERAFDGLEFIESIPVRAEEWYAKKKTRDDKARLEYRKMNRRDYVPGELYMTRILDEGVKPNDPRLQ